MIKVAVLTVSDSAVAGTREDLSGSVVQQRCRELEWDVIASDCIPDEIELVSTRIVDWVDSLSVDVVLSTGGTGISSRDNTPEATRAILDRELPGVAELVRAKGLEQTQFSVLSRGLAGTRKKSLIVNLPGSPRGALFSLTVIESLVPHILKLLRGETEHQS